MSKNTHISVEPNTPAEVKTRIPVWLYPSTLEVMNRAMKIANCKSRSEYLEKAALFYAGYVSGQDAVAYLPPVLVSALRSTIKAMEERISRLMFKQSVELDMVMNVLAAGMEISEDTLHALRGAADRRTVTLHAPDHIQVPVHQAGDGRRCRSPGQLRPLRRHP